MSLLEQALTQTEEQKIHTPEQDWSDSFAQKVVSADFEAAQNHRQYHDGRWEFADRLYNGWERQRTWEGTKIPRSSLGMFVVFQQIESMLPRIISAIFSDTPWFENGPQPGTTVMQADDARDVMLYQMEMARRNKNQSIREVVRRCVKSALKYGNGIFEIGWSDYTVTRKKYSRQNKNVLDMMGMPTGHVQSEITENNIEKRHQGPRFNYVSIKDFYIDPNCPSPQVQEARYAQTRALMTTDQLKALRKQGEFDIPGDSELIAMAKNKASRRGDITKDGIDAARGQNWSSAQDSSLDPGAMRIEVITDWREDRCVWLANPGDPSAAVLYNEPNPYGFIPLFNAFYTDLLDRFYGLAVTDVTEGEHRLQGAIINGRIDELALSIHGARIKKRGGSVPASQLRRRPGQIIEVENPREDIVTEQVQNITQQAFIEVGESGNRVQKTTGLTDLVQGVGATGGNSANRTAAGVGVQAQGAASRIVYLVEGIEDTFIEPILSAWHQLNTMFLDPNEILQILHKDVDPLEIINADVMFYMRASAKMQSRMALMQSFPLIAQTFMNPAFIQTLERQGKTVDIEEMWTMLLDMTGYKTRGTFIRPLTDQEKQAMQQAASQENNVELVKQRERMSAMAEMQDSKMTGELQKVVVGKGLDLAMMPEEKESE